MRSTELQFELDSSADARRAGIRKHLLLGIWLCLASAQWAMGQQNMPTYSDITDSSLGMRWHLVVDPSHPEQPGRWTLLAMQPERVARRTHQPARDRTFVEERKLGLSGPAGRRDPVIHAGERVIVTQRTAEVDAHFRAIALEPARAGEHFRARLLAMQSPVAVVVLAQASGPGEAVWVGSKELRQ